MSALGKTLLANQAEELAAADETLRAAGISDAILSALVDDLGPTVLLVDDRGSLARAVHEHLELLTFSPDAFERFFAARGIEVSDVRGMLDVIADSDVATALAVACFIRWNNAQ